MMWRLRAGRGSAELEENPLDALPLGERFETENILLGVFPWLVLSASEWVTAWHSVSFGGGALASILMVEMILLWPVFGFLGHFLAVRMFQNLCRRIPHQQLRVTPISAKCIVSWIDRQHRRLHMLGFAINAVSFAGVAIFLVHMAPVGTGRVGALMVFWAIITGVKFFYGVYVQPSIVIVGLNKYFGMRTFRGNRSDVVISLLAPWFAFLVLLLGLAIAIRHLPPGMPGLASLSIPALLVVYLRYMSTLDIELATRSLEEWWREE